MTRRLLSWLRTWVKLALLFIGYFWVGAAYKLVYAQTHDVTRFKTELENRLPISYYQQQFFLDSLLHVTWLSPPDFRQYIGDLPPLGSLFSPNGLTLLAGYLERREQQLAGLPDRYPNSLFREEALEDAFGISQGASVMGVVGTRQRPDLALSARGPGGRWRSAGVPDFTRATALARRLADGYPDSTQAPVALLRVAQAEAQAGHLRENQAVFRRLAAEYPRSEQAEEAFNQLYTAAQADGRLELAREYRRRALDVAEAVGHERFESRPLPAKTTLSLMGFRLDLASLNLRFQRLPIAQNLLAVAAREADALKSLPTLEQSLKNGLRDRREQMERTRSELWVAELYDAMKVGVPGPPPRAHEHSVSGAVTLDGRPLPGVEVLLSDERIRLGEGFEIVGSVASVHYRAVADLRGRYEIPGVPAGKYYRSVLYPIQLPEGGGLVVPSAERPPPDGKESPSDEVTVTDRPVKLPSVTLEKALVSRTWGEVGPTGNSIRLEWEPWSGAVAYRVQVVPALNLGAFGSHLDEWRKHGPGGSGVLWKAEHATGTHADCPLLTLAPDQPLLPQAIEYAYRVTAMDGSGLELAQTSIPLSRFHLSAAARTALLALKPPTRVPPGGRRGFGRRGFGRGRPGRGGFGRGGFGRGNQ